ncbi:MAG: 50S ribosomal protein L29 [Deltaproteobacteria bacterium CG07_land_8_20_14_0_80_38_7]|nr:MAG: 50S ribosomal protein L29 [Deltaproteobacteria bacterium CG07_land_8_20_14_0_80_38_7]
MKPVEIKEKTLNELVSLEKKISEELFQLKFKLSTGQLKQISDVSKKKQSLARVKTFIRQKELAQNK